LEAQMQGIYAKLDELTIRYAQTDHRALFTIEELVEEGLYKIGEVPKNLFLRDASGKHHYLIVMQKDKQADLIAIRKAIQSSRLSFASEQRLEKHLHVQKGSVTPLAVLFDDDHAVRVFVDRDLLAYDTLGVHPGVNTRTLWIAVDDLLCYLSQCNHEASFLTL